VIVSMAAGETPYTTICKKEKTKGTLPSICLKYCRIAEQGCHLGLWEWKEQNGCTEEQEAHYIELRRMTLQACRDILENCGYRENQLDPEESETEIELSSSCLTFCETFSEGPTDQNYTYINEDQYVSLLKFCKDNKEKQDIETDPEDTDIPPTSSIEEKQKTEKPIPDIPSPPELLIPVPPITPIPEPPPPETPQLSQTLEDPKIPEGIPEDLCSEPIFPDTEYPADSINYLIYVPIPIFPKEIPKEIFYLLFFIYNIVLLILFRMVLTHRRKIISIEQKLSGLKKKH